VPLMLRKCYRFRNNYSMNNFPTYTIVGWETRNKRRHKKALVYCKDYGLSSLTSVVFAGELYPKERKEMRIKFKAIFTSKTDTFFFVVTCRSCFTENRADLLVDMVKKIGQPDHFELIQMSKNG
jgi:CRISPR/Cas system-associated endoribonuclease Cas2